MSSESVNSLTHSLTHKTIQGNGRTDRQTDLAISQCITPLLCSAYNLQTEGSSDVRFFRFVPNLERPGPVGF